MYLYLIQHGLAKTENEDPKRPLTEKGAQLTEKIAKIFSDLKPEIFEIRHSTKLRAKETAFIIAKALGKTELLKECEDLSPNSNVLELVDELNSSNKNILVVAHLPFLSKLTSALICNDQDREIVNFKNSGILCLCLKDKKWHIEWYLCPECL